MMKNITRKQMNEFNQEVIEILEFYGAVKVDEEFIQDGLITYIMDSEKIGKLYIKLDYELSPVYTIYARFEDTGKAINYFNVRPYNGKMNSHEYNSEPCLTFIDSLLDNYNQINGINLHDCVKA